MNQRTPSLSSHSPSVANFITLFIFFISLIEPCFSIPNTSLILPLTFQFITTKSLPRSTIKLQFHQNVSLTASLTVGTPPQNVTVVIDTGSELSWLQCNNSTTNRTRFYATHSKSYSPVHCESPTCTTRTRDFVVPVSCDSKNLCHAALSYADMSSTEGNLASDIFRFGWDEIPGMVFGCMDAVSDSNPDYSTGLMGMNLGSLSFISQTNYPKFSYCISDINLSGLLLLGEVNLTWLPPMNYTSLVRISDPLPSFNRVAYTVQLEGIKVAGKALAIDKSLLVPDHTGAGQTMIDSGTQFTFFVGPIYTALKNEFMNQTSELLKVLDDQNFVFQGAMDSCYRVPLNQSSLPILPTVTLAFQGAEISVSCETLLYRVPGEIRGNDWVYCLTFGNSDLLGVEANVIGHHQQRNVWMEFDLERSRIGLVSVRCDVAARRLGVGT